MHVFPNPVTFHGFSSAAYGNGIVRSERKILAKIYLGVICAHMGDFHRPGHVYWECLMNLMNLGQIVNLKPFNIN